MAALIQKPVSPGAFPELQVVVEASEAVFVKSVGDRLVVTFTVVF